MKTLVISDIHSNIIALDAIWKRESDADLIVCAGDIVDYGIYPGECIDWMIDKGARVVSGNHDRGVIQAYEKPEEDVPLTWRIENARQLDPHHIEYLKNLPIQLTLDIEGQTYGVTHAYRGYDTLRSVEAFERFSDDCFGQRLHRMIFGHTHRRELNYLSDEHYWLNPGSISYRRPDEDYRGAHYAVIQDGHISLRTVPYPAEPLYQAMLASAVCEADKSPLRLWWSPK